MRSQRVAQEIYSDEVDEMTMEERVGRLEVKVDHIQSDVTDLKTGVRELRAGLHTLGQAIGAQGTELRAEIHEIRVSLEKFRGQVWVALAVLIVLQLLTMGGAPAAIARAFKFL